MILQSITLNGFKSFAKKTSIDLNFPITAFVGPNGSGKSNVADAMRWVIGEQAISNIRAGKQEDLIFAGSATTGPKGMAEVTLQFENRAEQNQQTFFDLPYAEVAFGRTVHRDGVGEYWLNNERILLREMLGILAESGLGSYDLTVIGQGEIDQILNKGSQEIQSLLEDASGVKPFFIKKNRTVNHLKRAGQSVQRLNDILGELEPQLRTLKRESRQAEAHRELSAELATLQRQWYGRRLAQIDQELAKVKAMLDATARQVSDKRQTVHQLEREIAATEGEINTQRGKLSAQQDEIDALQRALQKRWQEHATLEAKLELNKSQIGSLSEKKEQGAKREELTKQQQTMETKLTPSAEALEQAKQTRAQLEAELETLQGKQRELFDHWQQLRTEQLKTADMNTVRGQWKQVRGLLAKLRELLGQKGKATDKLAAVEQLSAEVEAAGQQLERALGEPSADDKARLDEVQAKLDATKQQLVKLNRELSETKQRINQQYQAHKQLENQLQGILRQLSQLDREANPQRQEMIAALQKEQAILQGQIGELSKEIREQEAVLAQKKAALKAGFDQRELQDALSEQRRQLMLARSESGKLASQQQAIVVEQARLSTKREEVLGQAKDTYDLSEEALTSLLGKANLEAEADQSVAQLEPQELSNRIHELRGKLERIGDVNQKAPEAYREIEQRYEGLFAAKADLDRAMRYVERGIGEIDRHVEQLFDQVFTETKRHFQEYFSLLFSGGEGKLERQDNVFGEKEITIRAKPPGKRMHDLNLLSGGERSMGAVALLFAILETCKTPFCVLDEVDAALDDANVGRFCQAIKRLNARTQIVLITHNRRTMEVADCLYGTTMEANGVTNIVSLKLQDVEEKAS